MTPEYLCELADLADPDKLWRLSGIDQRAFTALQRTQVDTGVALRRYASHVREVQAAYAKGKSVATTKLAPSTYAVCEIDPPPNHQRSIDLRAARTRGDEVGKSPASNSGGAA